MKFLHIQALYFVWAVPVLFFICLYGMRRRRSILKGFADQAGLAAIVSQPSGRRRWIRIGLELAALLFGILALSGPQYGYRWEKVVRKGGDIVVALDCSRSMLATDIRPTRLQRAKYEIMDLLHLLKGDRAGLVAFAGTAFLQCPLTLDYSGFHIFLNALSPDYLPVGGTDISAAIHTAMGAFNMHDDTDKAILLITDGGSTTGDPIPAARAAAKAGIRIYCIGVGSVSGVPVPGAHGGFQTDANGNIVMSRLDAKTLEKIARITGGVYARSTAGSLDLKAIYTDGIQKQMHPKTLASSRKQVWEDRYQWLLAVAIAALAIDMFVSSAPKATAMFLLGFLCLPVISANAASAYESTRQGLAAYQKKDYGKALQDFIGAQLQAPDRPESYYNLGNAYYKLGKFDDALRNYRQALKSKDPSLREKLYYNMGNTLFRQQKDKNAIKSYESALKIDPKDRQARENLEFVKKAMKQKKKPQKSEESKHSGNSSKEKKNEAGSKHPAGQGRKNQAPKKANAGKQRPPARKKSGSSGQRPPNVDRGQPPGKKKPQSGPKGQGHGQAPSAQNQPAGESGAKSGLTPAAAQAQRLLNRLHDQPGRAMIPECGRRRVAKDW